METKYIIHLTPFCDSDFLKNYGEIFYQADALSNVIGLSSTLDLFQTFQEDKRVRVIRNWNDTNKAS